jgi:hypothetical protein
MLGISKFFVSFKELLAYYFLFDTIALSLTASIVGYQGLGATVNVLS